MVVLDRAVGCSGPRPGVLGQVVGRVPVQAGFGPALPCIATDLVAQRQFGQQFEAVVVGGGPEQFERNRSHQHLVDGCGKVIGGEAARTSRSSRAHLHLIDRHHVTGRGEPCVAAQRELDREMHLARASGDRARHGHLDRRVRRHRGKRERAPPQHLTIHQQRPTRPVHVEPGERLAVGHPQRSGPPTALHRDGPIHPRHLGHCRMRFEVGRHQTVGHEVPIVRRLTELPAIREAHCAVGQSLTQPVILPLPDEPALEARRGGDDRPVVGQRAVRVAHRVAVLAQDERTGAPARLAVGTNGVDGRVHRADEIGGGESTVDPAGVEHGALVVQRAAGVVLADPAGERVVVGAVTALVAEAPHDDGRVVAVAAHHARTTGHPGGQVALVVTQAGVVGVALEVGLVDDVHTQLVAQVVERRVVGVVRGAHRGDVVPPHLHQVGAHVVDRDRLAAIGMVIVAVHAEDPDRPAIHQQLAVAHLDVPEADQLLGGLGDCAVGPQQLDTNPVAAG